MRMGRLEYLWLGFIAFAVLLAYAIQGDLSSRAVTMQGVIDFVAPRIPAIEQLAEVSEFPGTTRAVLSILAMLFPLLFMVHWLVPGFVTWRPEEYRPSRILLAGFVVFVLAMTVLLPFVFTIDAAALETGSRRERAFGILVHSRLGLGIGGGVYCVVSAYLLACLPRAIRALFARR
jgi:hypothetical protein